MLITGDAAVKLDLNKKNMMVGWWFFKVFIAVNAKELLD